MNAAQEIAKNYTLAQITQARKVASRQGDATTAALLAKAYSARFDLVRALARQDHMAKMVPGGVNVA